MSNFYCDKVIAIIALTLRYVRGTYYQSSVLLWAKHVIVAVRPSVL